LTKAVQPIEIQELTTVIAGLEPEIQIKLTPVFKKLVATLSKRYETLELVEEALGQLRVDIKYLIFDLEATKRERDEFKALWENRT